MVCGVEGRMYMEIYKEKLFEFWDVLYGKVYGWFLNYGMSNNN